jgi:hypothetical protein
VTIAIFLNVVLFLGMGIHALARPHSVVASVGIVPETADARNEVRAVYGGFGIATAVLLVVASEDIQLRSGVLLAVAVALLGMAAAGDQPFHRAARQVAVDIPGCRVGFWGLAAMGSLSRPWTYELE